MKKNAYFQLIHKMSGVWLKVYEACEDGNPITADDVINYLNLKSILIYNIAGLSQYIREGDFSKEFLLGPDAGISDVEEVQAKVDKKGRFASLRFYPPYQGGKSLTKADIFQEIQEKGIVHGINERIVDALAIKRDYCTDYVFAKATMPRQGHDAMITYHFDTDTIARPERQADGSVDFHKLGTIKPVQPGDVLATLDPADQGEAGISVLGSPIPQKKVKAKHLRYGRNITLAEDNLSITSDVAGHVSLVGDLVVVSDVYQVRNNVDASTGDIEYNGTVEVDGNVLTGYKVYAEGDIIVNGIAEGAVLEAGGNIILKSGMQGMSRGMLKAKGDLAARFLENCFVEIGGELTADAIMHSQITAGGDVTVTGKRGLVTGGYIKTYGNIKVSTVGSTMGTDTRLEILSNTRIQSLVKELQDQIYSKIDEVKMMDQVLLRLSEVLRQGKALLPEQKEYLKLTRVNRNNLVEDIDALKSQMAVLNKQVVQKKGASIRVENRAFSGTKIVIREMTRIIPDTVTQTEFTLEGAEVKGNVIVY